MKTGVNKKIQRMKKEVRKERTESRTSNNSARIEKEEKK
jgi:hypothetical protein